MKLNFAALVLAAAGLASAAPLRVVVVSTSMGDPIEAAAARPGHIRFGHPVATIKGETFPQAGPDRGMRRPMPCAGRMSRFREKALEISNSFRTALGMPPIEAADSPKHGLHILPFIGTPPTFIEVGAPNGDGTWSGRTKGGELTRIVPFDHPSNPPPGPHRHHRPHHHIHTHEQPFLTRLHYSLINLGTWEGRAVAFVLGCGIGVLLRMIFVLSVVALRSIRGEQNYHYTTIAVIEEVDEAIPSPPPTYVYPVDEKIRAEEAVKDAPLAPQSDN